MIQGAVSKLSEVTVASATTIQPILGEVVLLTGTTQVDTIIPPFGKQFDQMLVLIPISGSVVLGTGGNILVGITAVINRAVFMIYRKATDKWYINSGV